jgi:4-hydroxy-tetrahydrodipicolinate synthase
LLFVETNPAPAKWLLHRLGVLPCGAVRPPLTEPSEHAQQRILALFDQARDLVPAPLEVLNS